VTTLMICPVAIVPVHSDSDIVAAPWFGMPGTISLVSDIVGRGDELL